MGILKLIFGGFILVTCCTKYVFDPSKLHSFETFIKMLIPIYKRLGASGVNYLLPYEGPNNIALELFSFSSLAAYDEFRTIRKSDPEYQSACKYAEKCGFILSYDRSFMRPVPEF